MNIDPGPGYRLLGDDEPAIEGDDYANLTANGGIIGTWQTVYGLAGRSRRQHGLKDIVFRRKVEVPSESMHFL